MSPPPLPTPSSRMRPTSATPSGRDAIEDIASRASVSDDEMDRGQLPAGRGLSPALARNCRRRLLARTGRQPESINGVLAVP